MYASLVQLQQFFEYVAFVVMVRNGDGHLKNFGLLYEHPRDAGSIRLAPLYDVVTTSIYDVAGGTSPITKYDRTLALKLAKTRSYPNRKTLLEFGKIICQVMHQERLNALTSARDEGRRSVQPAQVLIRPPVTD